jgi:xanthine dehydrogenase accessory factor
MAKVWGRIRETIERHGRTALISIIDAAGSAPREPGARIVLRPDGGFFGTIGGGRLEYEAIAAARAALATGRSEAQIRDWPLGPNLGQCCGGMVKTLTETFAAADLATVRDFEAAEQAGNFSTESRLGEDGRVVRTIVPDADGALATKALSFTATSFRECFGEASTAVLLFGAGHVGRALVLALAPLPFAVRWIDSRADQFPQHVPRNVVVVTTPDAERELNQAPTGAMVVVMTHSHPLDFDITAAALQQRKFAFVGLIGSETKRARFASFARQLGIAGREMEQLVCPVGLPHIKGKEPSIIAASLAAQLLVAREQSAAVRESPAVQPA